MAKEFGMPYFSKVIMPVLYSLLSNAHIDIITLEPMIVSGFIGDYCGKILFDVIQSTCLPLENRKNHLLGPLYLSELYDMV